MTTYTLNAGSGEVLLSTAWSQSGKFPGSSVTYNIYCPIDPDTQNRSITGCTNTAAAQILYYWIEHGFELKLTLTEDDSYVSKLTDTTITIDATAEMAEQNGYLSFAEVNEKLSDFDITDVEDCAALTFACGVVQRAYYSSTGTSTAWSNELFYRAGMAGCTCIYADNSYFFETSGDKYRITDAGYEVLINELLAGRPVGTTFPGHALIFDGYDAENDTFHINFGWGGYSNRWYTRDEIYEKQFYSFYIDLIPEYDGAPILVTSSAAYGVGTFLRGLEQIQGITDATTLTVPTDVAGCQLALPSSLFFNKDVTINNFNSELHFTGTSYGIWNTKLLTINGFSGAIHIFQDSYVTYALCCPGSNGSLLINDFSGCITSVSNQSVAWGMDYADTTVTNFSGSVEAVSNTSSAYSISGSFQVDNLSGCIFARTKGTKAIPSAINGKSVELDNVTGSIISIANSHWSYGLRATDALNVTLNDGRIYAGQLNDDTLTSSLKTDLKQFGEAGIDSATEYNTYVDSKSYAIYGSSKDDYVLAKNYASIQGCINLGNGTDTLSVLGDSFVYAPSVFYVETLTIDSTSTLSGVFYGSAASCMTVNMILTGETPSAEIIHLQNYCYNFVYYLNNKTIDIDLRAAVDGEYVLIDAVGVSDAKCFSQLSVKLSTGSQTFTLKCGETANNVSLEYRSEKLILVLDGYSDATAEAMLFTKETLVSVAESVSNKTLSEDGTDSLRLANGGTAQNITVGEEADLSVSSDGIATGTIVEAHGFLSVNDGGKAVNTTVNNDGILNLGNNAAHGGALSIAENAVVKAEESATIDFTLVGSSASDYQGINDISRIDGTPGYTLTLAQNQANGQYTLAGNAGDFDSAITVQGLETSYTLNLSDKKAFTDNGKKYELSQSDDNNLVLQISRLVPYITLTGDNTTPLQKSSITATTEDGGDIYTSTDQKNWTKYTGAIEVTANGTWYFKATDATGSLETAEIEFTNIDTTAPVITLTGDTTTPLQKSSITATTEAGLDIYTSTDNKNWTKYTGAIEVTANGTWYFKATDAAGNVGTNSIEFTNIDTTAPVITLTGDTTSPLQKSSITATTEAGVDIYYSTDNKTWEKYTAMLDVTANGTWYFKATDAAGNVGTNSIGFTNIDTTAPFISDVRIADEPDANALLSITFTCDDDVARRFYSFNDGAWTAFTGSELLLDQNGALRIKLVDMAGNESISDSIAVNRFNAQVDGLKQAVIQGTPDAIALSWNKGGVNCWTKEYYLELTVNGKLLDLPVIGSEGVELHGLGVADISWKVTPIQSEITTEGPDISFAGATGAGAQLVCPLDNGVTDALLARTFGTWNDSYQARHTGIRGDWEGTREVVALDGKNQISDIFAGSEDTTLLYLTDDENGDALFIDDIYSDLPDVLSEQQARFARIDDIRAGAGDDLVDMTSQRFDCVGDGVAIHGGLGNDTIWAGKGDNSLFGDDGDDRLVGASGNDILVGGIGNDTLQGGGGNDIFCFCKDWNEDTVEQLAGGDFRLWFAEGIDRESLTLSVSGEDTIISQTGTDNRVVVKNQTVSDVTTRLCFGANGLYNNLSYTDLAAAGAFSEATHERIFTVRQEKASYSWIA